MAAPTRWSPAETQLAGTAFTDVRWVDETGSTNADLLALARDGAPHGVVLVADHQTAGRGRRNRVWTAPPNASLLVSVLLRLPTAVAPLAAIAAGVAAVDGVERATGVKARLKWPNDLVWPGDNTADDRKLAGILAEADWPAGDDVAVVVGMGLNVTWPDDPPDELRGVAVAVNHITDAPAAREPILVEWLRALDAHIDSLRTAGAPPLLAAYRTRSATIGRRVQVDLGEERLSGDAVDIDATGHLVMQSQDGTRRTIAVGDVVHLRAQ